MTLQKKDLKEVGNYILSRLLNLKLQRDLVRSRETTLRSVWFPVRDQVWIQVRWNVYDKIKKA